jgi:hypothetical protein
MMSFYFLSYPMFLVSLYILFLLHDDYVLNEMK